MMIQGNGGGGAHAKIFPLVVLHHSPWLCWILC